MNKYQRIKSYDPDRMAAFIYGLISDTEEHIVGKLSALGIDISLCNLGEEMRIALIKKDLLEEQDDT